MLLHLIKCCTISLLPTQELSHPLCALPDILHKRHPSQLCGLCPLVWAAGPLEVLWELHCPLEATARGGAHYRPHSAAQVSKSSSCQASRGTRLLSMLVLITAFPVPHTHAHTPPHTHTHTPTQAGGITLWYLVHPFLCRLQTWAVDTG